MMPQPNTLWYAPSKYGSLAYYVCVILIFCFFLVGSSTWHQLQCLGDNTFQNNEEMEMANG